MIAFTLLTSFIYLDFLSWLSPLAFHFPKLSTRQWSYLTHRWELGLQTPRHIHTPVGHACRASRDLVSSETLWFCLEPRSIQLQSTTSRRFPYLSHIGLTEWEAIIGEEGLRTCLPFSWYSREGPSWSYGSWIYNYLCNQCLSPL
jgi:hypothetical protein